MTHSATADQILWHRLSVFAGSFAQEAAEAVCAGECIERSAVPDLLARLADQSLVLVEKHREEVRYRVPKPLCREALKRLDDSGETDTLQRRLADYYLTLAGEAEPGRLELEHDNLRGALRWSLESGEAEPGLRLAVALRFFWRHHLAEGQEWLAKLLALPLASARNATRAYALDVVGTLSFYAAYQSSDPQSDASQTDYSASRSLMEESLAIFRERGDRDGCATVLIHIGTRARLLEDDYPTARAMFEECLELARELRDEQGVTYATAHLAYLAMDQGDLPTARSLVEQNRVRNREAELRGEWIPGADPSLLDSAARFAAGHGQPERALRLAGAAAAHREARSVPSLLQDTLERRLEPARQALDGAVRAAAWAEGRAMTMDQAVTYALEGKE